MSNELSKAEWDEVLCSLEYTRRNINECPHYPTYEFKNRLLKENATLKQKIRRLRDANK